MSSRVTGAGLALIAVALLAVSVATPAVLPAQLSLFAGHPTVANHTRETQDVYVGLYSTELCNSGGDGTCKTGDATLPFRLCGYAELALTGGLALLGVTLALLTLRRSEARKTAARLVWVAGGLAIAAAAGLVLLGPFHGASAPIGIGMIVQGAGLLAAILGAVFAARPPPPIRLRVADRSQPHAALPTAQAFDRRAAREATARGGDGPDRLGFEARTRPPPQPLDAEPLSDPFAAPIPTSERSTLPSGPQLRPLYDAAPLHGGTGGLLPPERPGRSTQPPPTPAARAAMPGMPPPLPAPGMPPQHAQSAYPGIAPSAPGFSSQPGIAPPHAQSAYPGIAPSAPSFSSQPGIAPGMPPHPGMVPPSRAGLPALPFSADPRAGMPPFAADEPHAAGPPFAPDDPRAAALPFGADEPHAAAPPLDADGLRPTVQQPAAAPRTMPPPFGGDAPRSAVPQPISDEAQAVPPPFTEEPRQTAPRFSGAEPRPGAPRTMPPPTPPARSKSPSIAPGAPPPPPHAGSTGHKARTQVSLVPPMPDNDLPIGPPTAQIAGDARPESMQSAGGDPTLFPRPETPLAPPPLPVPPPPGPRSRSDSQLPPPLRGTQLPRPPLRAAVPMPARAGRATGPIQPPLPGQTQPPPLGSSQPLPTTLRGVPLPSAISTSHAGLGIPAIPMIPAIPPIPAPRRPDTDVTDPDGQSDADLDAATVSRVPIEVGEYDSQTNVSVDLPLPVAVAGVDQPTILGPAVNVGSRPTGQLAEQPLAPSPSRTVTPHGRGSMPNLPISTAPDSLPPPKDHKQALGPSPACPQCESPMAWVEEHLRFYCKSCRMYF